MRSDGAGIEVVLHNQMKMRTVAVHAKPREAGGSVGRPERGPGGLARVAPVSTKSSLGGAAAPENRVQRANRDSGPRGGGRGMTAAVRASGDVEA